MFEKRNEEERRYVRLKNKRGRDEERKDKRRRRKMRVWTRRDTEGRGE